MSGHMIVHCYVEGCGFNATIPGTSHWQGRQPMNAYELCRWVNKQQPESVSYSGDVQEARHALAVGLSDLGGPPEERAL